MPALRVFRRFRELQDVDFGTPADGDVPRYDAASGLLVMGADGGGGVGGATKLVELDDVTGTPSTGTAPVSDGAGTFPFTNVATQSELDAGLAALASVYQPLDSDLSAIAALATTTYGRALLTLADAAALRATAGLGSAATHAATDFDTAGSAAAAQAASQPLDSDLTAIAALATTTYGRSLLALVDAAALRSTAGLGTIATHDTSEFQPSDADLTAIAALSTTAYGRSLLTAADAAAARATLGVPDPQWTVVTKSLDESVLNSAAVQDDDELFFTAVNGAFYEVDLFIIYASPGGGGTPDIKIQLTDGGTITGSYVANAPSTGDSGGNSVAVNGSTIAVGTGTAKRMMRILAWQVGTGAVVHFKWAQSTADAVNASIVYAGSILRYRRIA